MFNNRIKYRDFVWVKNGFYAGACGYAVGKSLWTVYVTIKGSEGYMTIPFSYWDLEVIDD